jgi:large subunit ribosomal protein L3
VAHLKKAGVPLVSHLREVGLDAGDEVKAGDTINVSMFEGVGFVDVIGTTKGRGFQGVVRRHQMAGGPKTHGGHSKRRIGAIGQRALSARVHKGHRMPGHMGHVRATQQNLRVVEVRATENLLLVQGSIPGPTGAVVLVRKALKKK